MQILLCKRRFIRGLGQAVVEDVSSVSDAISQSNVHVASFGVMFIEFDIGSDSHPVVACKTADEDTVRHGIAHLG